MIDRIKIGSFLQELRKEKKLSQEALAEKFGVSSRSISRWENGNTMPELGMLVDLADFYQVDIKEIIDGERKTENMNHKTNGDLKKVAEYSEAEKNLVMKRQRIVFLIVMAALVAGMALGFIFLPELSESSFLTIQKLMGGTALAGLICLWSVVIYERYKSKNKPQD